jgi:type I restriction enzyme S subunit
MNLTDAKLRIKNIVNIPRKRIVREARQKYQPVGVLNRGRGIFFKKESFGSDLGDSNFFLVEPDALVISGQFAWEGAVALTTQEHEGCIASHRYYILQAKHEFCKTEYLWAFFRTKYGDLVLNQCSHGAAGRNKPLNFAELLNEYIPLPNIALQQNIAMQVQLLMTFREKVKQIEIFLTEYRTRLISDVVTGKVDVRSGVVPEYDTAVDVAVNEDDLFDNEDFTEDE